MRMMSFMLTTQQVIEQSKTVTRRHGWMFVGVGDIIQPVPKAQGLKKGERVEKLGCPIEVVAADIENLDDLLIDRDYGLSEMIREGLPNMDPTEFVQMFCKTHKGVTTKTAIMRIEFKYRNDLQQ